MDNIWADSFSEIRELSLQEKKEEKKEGKPKRWWDDDGDGIGYEKGEVSGKFKKTKKEGKDYDPMEDPEFDHDEAERTRGQSGKHAKKKTKKEEVEIEEGLKQARKNVGASKCWSGYKAQGTKKKGGKEVPNCVPEERELHSKNDKNDRLDVRKGIHNKINTKPTVSEEIEAWIDQLLAEGYDLSKFTLDEVVDIYESTEVEQLDEADTYGMPPKGDAERQKADPMAAAKAKAARAKVSKERADLQVAQQSQRLKVSATESVLAYVESRTTLSEKFSADKVLKDISK